jgi:ADP-ribose pyrophosphatase YjhB (NUDIX family)
MVCICCRLLTWDYTIPDYTYYFRDYIDEPKAGGVLIYNGRVLIIQSKAEKWGFPKGGFERGETAAQCAEREVREETSFNVRFSDDDLKVKYKTTTLYVKYFQDEPPEIDIQYLKTPGNDCTGIGWIRLTCLKRLVKKEKEKRGMERKTLSLDTNEKEDMRFNLSVRNFVKRYMLK